DGTKWFDGKASCVLIGNVGTITGGIRAFDDAEPDDGWLEAGVLPRKGAGQSARSPFVRMTRAKTIDVRFAAPMTYELDGGARKAVTRLKATVVPDAITVCVPDG